MENINGASPSRKEKELPARKSASMVNERVHQLVWNKPELEEMKFSACCINYNG